MTALDSLPADQRAVVELVLARGRDYDEIARMLSIDRAGVRQRALSALDALGADTEVPAPRRALITDYLLGQLPPRVAEDVAGRLAREPTEAAWARTVADAVGPLAAEPLPPIGDVAPEEDEAPPVTASRVAAVPAAGEARPEDAEGGLGAATTARRPSSRRGGAIVLGLGLLALAAIVAIIVAAVSGGGSSTSHSSTVAAAPSSTATTASTPSRLLPTATGSKAQGEAVAFTQSGAEYLAVVAIHLSPNSTTGAKNYYAVWLSDGAGASRLLGFAPPVTTNGQLRAATKVTSADAKYTKLLVTLETVTRPNAPGPVVLSGAIRIR